MRKMKIKLGILSVLAALFLFAACGKDTEEKPDYGYLKEDIVGVWCSLDGPEFIENGDWKFYIMWEFCEDGRLIYHKPYDGYSGFDEHSYEIKDNLLVVDNEAGCYIEVKDNILTMTNDNGATEYRRMGIDEVTGYDVICFGEKSRAEQDEYRAAHPEEESGENEQSADTEAVDTAA